MLGSKKHYENKTDYVKEFGKELGWKIEEDEFVNLENVGWYQTADETDEDAYPEPTNRKQAIIEKTDTSLEETYHWFLQFLRYDLGYPQVDKIYDIFSSSESSAMFGNVAQKQGIQQDRAVQFLRSIGVMIKELFPLVRELRVLDERMELYKNWDKSKSADITLKQHYVQFVEGGGQNPDSIYGLATRIGYAVLPDLFFNTHVYDLGGIDDAVDKGETSEFNKNVRTVLKRKLYGYINWRNNIMQETVSKRKFQVRYLRQHWKAIELNMAWVKPYIKTAHRMNRNSKQLDSPDLINAFDHTILEIEVLAKKPTDLKNKDKHYRCILANFRYDTKPTLTFKPEWGQQAVAHTGKVTVTLRSYGWHQKDIETYKKMRQEEDMSIISSIDEHVGGAFEAMKEDIERYLEEAGEENMIAKRAEEKKQQEQDDADFNEAKRIHDKNSKFGLLGPFLDIGRGFGELGKSFFENSSSEKKKSDKKEAEKEKPRDDNKIKEAGKGASKDLSITYVVYKKTHQLLNW
ncbi:hypothetical protein JXA48_04420 [Candidatus Woesearchaeota archaeon]|nr:hypothetical protein [Candidatus Woesearchaeota archaeon]